MSGLTGKTIWPVALIVVAVLGCVTYLAAIHIVAGTDVIMVVLSMLSGLGIITGAHVTGQILTSSFAARQEPHNEAP